MRFYKKILFLFVFLGTLVVSYLIGEQLFGIKSPGKNKWKELEPGLFLAEFTAPVTSPVGDSRITVLKINPNRYQLKLICASEYDGVSRPIETWAKKFHLLAAVNAGMYQKDNLTGVGFLKNFDHFNNPYLNSNNAILAFNPVDSTVPPVQIIDRTCQNFEELKRKYHSFLQSIRMISCHQENVWQPQSQRWSIAALGIDRFGNVLFIFTRSPYTVHNFINMLLTLPIKIYNAMYLEGGPVASLYISTGGFTLTRTGTFENGLLDNQPLNSTPPIPNVLGIVKKSIKER